MQMRGDKNGPPASQGHREGHGQAGGGGILSLVLWRVREAVMRACSSAELDLQNGSINLPIDFDSAMRQHTG